MYAIVKTGGKQYRVAPGSEITVEKLAGSAGDKVNLTALCVVDGAQVQAKAAEAANVAVSATILEQLRGPKSVVFKLKKRKNYKKKQGHRQALTRLYIDAVGDERADAPAPVVEAKPAEEIDDAQAIKDAEVAADEAESEAGLAEAAESEALDALDAEPETAEETSERDDLKADVEMADIQYEAASDIPAEDEAEDK